jgi:hypothetical protein
MPPGTLEPPLLSSAVFINGSETGRHLPERVAQHEDSQAVAHNVSANAGRETQVDLEE